MSRTGAALPDVNAETYPYSRVQTLLDQAACFSLLAVPETPFAGAPAPTLTPGDPGDYFGIQGGYGLATASRLHPFEARLAAASGGEGGPLASRPRAGRAAGRLSGRWLFCPEEHPWSPGAEPSPVLFDRWRSQPFVLLDCELLLGRRDDGFHGYGVGRTFPLVVDGVPQLLAGAVGNLTAGHGRFAGLEATFVLNGRITDGLGFLGNVTVRAPDPEGRLRSRRETPSPSSIAFPDDAAGYLVLRGEKADATTRTEYGPPPGPDLVSLRTPALVRAADFPFTDRGGAGLRARPRLGPVIGELAADVTLDILAPPGTAQRPNRFTTRNRYRFTGTQGEEIGSIEAEVVEGRSFALALPSAPGQAAMRYGGFGPVLGGSGLLAGARGLLTVNSAIGVAPHALSMINVLRLVEPPATPVPAGRAAGR